jgi:hypothetical protein
MSKKTLFEELKEEVEVEEGRSPFFYRRAFRRLTRQYLNNPKKFILDERRDSAQEDPEDQDENLLRRVPRQGHIYMFEYNPPFKKDVKVFDPFPLVYVISFDGKSFMGCNLHYIHPIKRKMVLDNLKDGKLTLPYSSISKYIISQIDGLLLDIAFNEWTVAANLPIEGFVSITKGEQKDLMLEDIWKQTNKSFRNMLRGSRIYKSYGQNDQDFKGT